MKTGKIKKTTLKDTLIRDEALSFSTKKGNGTLRRQIWIDKNGRVTRYSLAYINFRLFYGDNGRVLGYDNAHGFHHKHYMGTVIPSKFTNLVDLEQQCEAEFEVLHEKAKKKY